MPKITRKQQAFCQEYIIDFNGTQAAIRTGYSKKAGKENNTTFHKKIPEVKEDADQMSGNGAKSEGLRRPKPRSRIC